MPYKLVREARREEVRYMTDRGMWVLRPIQECWEKLGKAPVTVKWVDTNKGTPEDMMIRSRLVARNIKGMRRGGVTCLLGSHIWKPRGSSLSRAATKRKDLKWRKLLFIDVFVNRTVIPSARWTSTSTSRRNVDVLRVCVWKAGPLVMWVQTGRGRLGENVLRQVGGSRVCQGGLVCRGVLPSRQGHIVGCSW